MHTLSRRRPFAAALAGALAFALALTIAPLESAAADTTASTPTVSVSTTQGLNPDGETVTVTGTGFAPNPPATSGTRPPLAGQFGGVYVVLGAVADVWKPSDGASSGARQVLEQKWVLNPENVATVGGERAGAVAINPDGSFSVDFTVSEAAAQTLTQANFGVFTFAGSGAVVPAFETFTPLTFAVDEPQPEPAPVPTVEVSKTDGLNPAGETVTVRGSGFAPNPPTTDGTRPPLRGQFAGTYVVVGSVLDIWKPSEGAPSSARQVAQQKWVVNPENVAMIGGANAGAVAINPDGSFAVEFAVSKADADRFATGTFGVFTFAGSGAVYAPYETFAPLTFATGAPTPTPTPTPSTPAPTPAPTTEAPRENVTPGSLVWGVKQSFREYMTGTIARGSITASGVGQQGSNLVFPQSGPSFTGATGAVAYSGQVRYLGHSGLLDVSLRDPRVTVESASRASLSVSVNGRPVTIATLNLAAASRTANTDGSIRFAGVPATLTSSGTSVFSFQGNAFYPAGTALDPVTFTIGSPASSGNGATVAGATISGGALELARFVERPIPSEAPTTTGAELVGVDGDLLPGARIEARATGFQPGEEGIRVVVYSEPRLLGEVTADANGQAVWTGRLPDDLVGEHTLTFQGSVDRGVVLQIVDPALAAVGADECVVSDAQLDWGFKESFRAYVSGSIARGEWEVLDGATYAVPLFTFADGQGTINPGARTGEVGFDGGIRFTGHEGILDTLIANPRIVFTSATTAELIADITGTRQDFEEVEALDVRFLELNLAEAESGSRDNGTVTIMGIPTQLTVAGAEAFGTYPAGEPFDPISLTYSLPSDCAANPAEAPPGDLDGDAGAPGGSDAEPAGLSTSVLIAVIVVLLAVVIALAVMLLRRRAA